MRDSGVVPMGPGDLRPGTRLASLTWICPGKGGAAPNPVLRFLAQEGTPLYRFEPSPSVETGLCLRYGDVLDADKVKPDTYSYHIVWRPETAKESLDASPMFEIVDPARERSDAGPARNTRASERRACHRLESGVAR